MHNIVYGFLEGDIMNVVMYLRKSRADMELEAKGEMETLARHEKILLSIAKKQKLTVLDIYKELVSGDSISSRPLMQKLIEEVETGKWEGVLVMEVERLARGDTIDQGIVARAFKAGNTKIITPSKTYDPSNEFDEEYFEFGLFMSRREYKTINRRIQRGRVQSAKDGKYLGSVPPYGYDRIRIPNDKGYTLTPNAEADVVRMIYDMYLNGDGCTVIANQLDALKIKPRSGDYWSRASILDILKNPVYIGKIQWSKGNQNILVDGLHEPIIDIKTFEKAQDIRKQNTRPPLKIGATLQNPLSGLIVCKKCGYTMNRLGANSRNRYDTIRCSNRYCDNVSAPIYLVEKKLLSEFRDWLNDYSLTIKDTKDDDNKDDLKRKQLKNMYAEVKKIELQINKTYDLLEQEIYTIEVFKARNKSLSTQKDELLKSISELEQELSTPKQTPELDISEIRKVLDTYARLKSIEGKNKILKTLLNKVEYEKDTPNRKGQINNANFSLTLYPKIPEN